MPEYSVDLCVATRPIGRNIYADILFWRRQVPQSKIIDRRKAHKPGEYGIGFASRAVKNDYEHAFVIWFYSDPKGKRTVRRGAGFYPAGTKDKAYDLVMGISGTVDDDSK